MGIFGFSTETKEGGDFLPILKYDARAGRFFRVDRFNNGAGFESANVDITNIFKAVVDFEHVEVGWLNFQPGTAPSMVLVPYGQKFPDKPSDQHKQGIRLMMKLSKECTGNDGKAVREVAGNSKAFLSGIEVAFEEYLAKKDANKGKLPVLALEKTVPVKTGSGAQSSTNYHPVFKIVGWVARGDFAHHPKANGGAQPQAASVAPATGSTQRAAPAQAPAENLADDFG